MSRAAKKTLGALKEMVFDQKQEYRSQREEKKLTDHQAKQYFIRFFAGFMALWVILSLANGMR